MACDAFGNNYGDRRTFPVSPGMGGVIATNRVQLVSARVEAPRQWVVVHPPIVKAGNRQVPWLTTLEGQSGAVANPNAVPQSPAWGGATMSALGFRVELRWGAGAVRFESEYEYPAAGGAFGIVADTLDLDVTDAGGLASTVYPSEADLPVFGAVMVPGVPQSYAPMRLRDGVSYAVPAGDSAAYAVKPFARWLYVAQLDGAMHEPYDVWFRGREWAGASWKMYDVKPDTRIPVPPDATVVEVVNRSAADAHVYGLTWELVFS